MFTQPHPQHEALDSAHFRLLLLFPASFSSPIRCSLVIANLLDFDDISGIGSSDVKGYEAVSYVWGNISDTTVVECNNAGFEITTSLEAALRHFRYTTKTRVLWADAICINQADQVEKAQQVSLMSLIYWKAKGVLIWLGPDTETDERWSASRAARLIQDIHQLYHDLDRDDTASSRLNQYNVESVGERTDDDGWEAVRRLLDRKWFTRVWVVQELGLSSRATFYCGNTSFDGECFERMLGFLATRAPMLASFFKFNVRVLELGFSYMDSTRGSYRLELGADPTMAESFLDILEMSRGLECTDSRDTVYAFLGHPAAFKQQHLDMAPYQWYPRNLYDGKSTVIDPDYDEEVTAQDVYLRLAYILIVEQSIGLELLSHVMHNQETIHDDHPSWIPRWNVFGPCMWSSSYSASDGLPQSSLFLALDNEDMDTGVQLKALCLGTVYFALQFPSAPHFSITPNHNIRHLDEPSDLEPANPVEIAYSCLEELGQPFQNFVFDDMFGFASTLTAGLMKNVDFITEIAQDNSVTHLRNFHAYRCAKAQASSNAKHPVDCIQCVGSPPGERVQGDAEFYSRSLQDAAPYRAFFGTIDGRIGLGPAILEGGDQVWLPMGAKMPFIFRPFEGNVFQVLGRTYLHGVMRGEAVAGLTEDDFQTVTLC